MKITAEQIELAKKAAKQNPAVARYIAKLALDSQRSLLALPYYSRFALIPEVVYDEGPPATTTYTIPAGQEAIAFGYAVHDDMGAVNLGGINATYVDTNITKRGETVSGQEVTVHGISIQYGPLNDAFLTAMFASLVSVRVKVDGQEDLMLGPMSLIPGSGGLIGGTSDILEPSVHKTRGAPYDPPQNGIERIDNYLPMPYPIKWKPSGKPDSTLTVVLRTERQAVHVAANRAAGDVCDCMAWDPPKDMVVLTGWVRLHCSQETKRSVNR